jgi:hypothetical protein
VLCPEPTFCPLKSTLAFASLPLMPVNLNRNETALP